MRRFLLCFSVFCGSLLLLCLLPGTQRLIGSDVPVAPPEPVHATPLMPALLVGGSATEPRYWEVALQQPAPRQAIPCSSVREGKAERQALATLHDANGNALSRRSYRHSVYQVFILGDMMG